MAESSGVGKLLPNIKVTVGEENLSGEFSSLEDGEISETESQFPSAVLTEKEFAFKWASTSKQTEKVHPNKYGGFETGLDLSSEHLIKKLESRAARFGLKKEEQRQITSKEIQALYKSLGMDLENLESSCKNIRLGVIHMRGVKEMSTEDVLGYFKDYGPSAAEWINDVSCNVCWYDDVSAARALLGVSQPIIIKRKNKNNSEAKGSSENGGSSEETDKSATAISEDKEIKELTDAKEFTVPELEVNKKDNLAIRASTSGETAMDVDEESSDSESEDDLKKVEFDISVPPGHWRLGVAHPKAGTLLLRFATKDDKKLPGAEKRSQYYQKYGNPNYGGLKGLISKSRKRKFQAMHTRQVVESLSANKDVSPVPGIKRIRQRLNIPVNRMRMYADIEEDKKAQSSSQSHGRYKNRPSIKSRLGKRYSKNDLCEIGNEFSFEEDAPVEELSVECKIPSRFSIWNEQAKAMAREDRGEFGREDEEEESGDEDEEIDEEEEEYSRRDKRYCAYGSERSSYESQKQYAHSDYSKDLREALSSSRRRNEAPREALSSSRRRNEAPRRDLRSRIGNLKKDAKSRKHISPLLRDDL